MILLTRVNGEKYYLNPGLIEAIEGGPDTIVIMTNGKRHQVLESAQVVARQIEGYRTRILARAHDTLDLIADIEPFQNEHAEE